jgi:hypothetical protein
MLISVGMLGIGCCVKMMNARYELGKREKLEDESYPTHHCVVEKNNLNINRADDNLNWHRRL